MSGLKIITADERMAERKGVKALIVGKAGVGKTSLLKTVNPDTTLFLDLEAGDLAVQDVPVDQVRPQTWQECRDIACFLAGPDLNVRPNDLYGQHHYDACVEKFGAAEALDKYETVFLDSITVAGRKCFAWCEQQPEAFNAKGVKDLQGTYGLHGRQMIAWVNRLQRARTRNIVLVCILNEEEDDFGRKAWTLQIDGQKSGRELPGILDEVITMTIITPDEGEPFRAFVTNFDNEWGFPAKDRSGRLDPLEPPHLGKLFAKINDTAQGPSAKTYPRAAA